ncbi:ParB/RepB/Spo0J family partition protein [Thioalkalivibrio sp. ALE16]|uniref:ParB/RepB/Spo0J family partition protein n=1 Tax=Thioalkalivibrio sp. ALE16 TaxID=1158172 RepID=UPI0009DBD209|nr:ParB/RepB/Spo0J family partition protein [Thioalkalivibrio sp. ALE16]
MAGTRAEKNKRRFSLASTSAGEKPSVGEGVARELAQSEHFGEGELQSIRVDRIHTSEVNPRKLPVDSVWIQGLADRARNALGRKSGTAADEAILEQLDQEIADLSDVRTRTALETLMVLARSIHSDRLISPVTVRFVEGRGYELIAGERRFLAHILLGRTNIRALLRRLDREDPNDVLKGEITSLMENIAREDLTMAEQINAIERIVDAKQRVDPDWVLNGVNLMRLLHQPRRRAYRYVEALTAPPEIRAQINDGTLDSFRSIEEAKREHEGAQTKAGSKDDPESPGRPAGKRSSSKVSIRFEKAELDLLRNLLIRALGEERARNLGIDEMEWGDAKTARAAFSKIFAALDDQGET